MIAVLFFYSILIFWCLNVKFTASFLSFVLKDAFPKGQVYIGNKGYEVVEGFGPGYKDSGFGFILKTPDRSFQFSSDSEDDQKEWMRVINDIIRGTSAL